MNKNYKYYTVGKIVPKSNRKLVERGQLDTSNTQIHNRAPSWISVDTQSGGVKLVIFAK